MPPPSLRRFARPALLVALLAAVWWVASRSEWAAGLTAERLDARVTEAGALGPLVFLALFTAGVMAQIPGVVFIVAARLAYGPVGGFLLGYLGSVVAVTLAFTALRAIGGQALGELKFGPAQRLLARLDARPVWTVAVLRGLLLLSPPLNAALAMTRVSHRDHLLGSVVGLVVPVAAWMFLSEVAVGLMRSLLA